MKNKRKRTSVIWTLSKEKIEKVVRENDSLSKILKYFGFVTSHGNYKTLKKRLLEDNIDYSHIMLGRNSNIGRNFNKKARPLEEVMVENSDYCRGNLKKRLINNNILEEKCQICGQLPIWNNKKLVLALDHVNGINNDNRFENLRLLCPNCHSQTPTFGGVKKNRKKYHCKECGKEITKLSKIGLCKKCLGINQRKIKERPTKEQLKEELKNSNFCKMGRKYGVSDNCIRKWLK